MAGNTASANIEGFVYTAMNALYQTNLSFTSQNIGARMYTRKPDPVYLPWYGDGGGNGPLAFGCDWGNGSSENLFLRIRK